MKKIYINPKLQVVEIHTMQMLAASLGMVDDTTPTPGTTLGREDDFDWDEEEE